MVSLDLLIVIAGILYGYATPGRQDKWGILIKGLKVGVILGIALGVIGLLLGGALVGLTAGVVGLIALPLVAFVITVEFIIGVFIGDFLEHAR